jgi:hypothetical protein
MIGGSLVFFDLSMLLFTKTLAYVPVEGHVDSYSWLPGTSFTINQFS